jgi:hypothetical protein
MFKPNPNSKRINNPMQSKPGKRWGAFIEKMVGRMGQVITRIQRLDKGAYMPNLCPGSRPRNPKIAANINYEHLRILNGLPWRGTVLTTKEENAHGTQS